MKSRLANLYNGDARMDVERDGARFRVELAGRITTHNKDASCYR
jgi:hypothetical protein